MKTKTTSSNGSRDIVKGTGLLVIEVINTNPNGDPDKEVSPRFRDDGIGEISGVSFKRKIRDLICQKEGPVWLSIAQDLELNPDHFRIVETRGRTKEEMLAEVQAGTFIPTYWDARTFGSALLELSKKDNLLTPEQKAEIIKTGAVVFGLGLSIVPINIRMLTLTSKAGVQEGKDRGMAPMAYKVVEHGVYAMPFYVNPTQAYKSGCTQKDIDLLLKVIPHAYSHTASAVRTTVNLQHAWYAEHRPTKSGFHIGSCPDHLIISAMTPTRKGEQAASKKWSDYEVPTKLPPEIMSRLQSFRDLCAE